MAGSPAGRSSIDGAGAGRASDLYVRDPRRRPRSRDPRPSGHSAVRAQSQCGGSDMADAEASAAMAHLWAGGGAEADAGPALPERHAHDGSEDGVGRVGTDNSSNMAGGPVA